MKTKAKISLLLNLVLIGALIYVWTSHREPAADSVTPATPTLKAQVHAATSDAPQLMARQVVEARPFCWDQLLSTNGDYRIFVANLRAAGCPEGVVEDIVRGDARRAFHAKRVAMGVDGTIPGPWSARSQQETVAYVLGQNLTDAGGPVAADHDNQPTGLATLAAFLQNSELAGEEANDEQKRQIASLRQNLLAQISRPAQAPNNAPYPVPRSKTGATQFAQSAAENTPSSPAGTESASPPRWRPKPNRSLLQAAEAQSILGGLFGMGAVIQYEKYANTQSGLQPPQN